MNDPAAFYGKDGTQAISVFKRRLSSVMALVMNRNTLFFVAAIVLVALAACGKGSDEKAAAPAQDGAAVSQPAAPAEGASEKKGPDLVKALREKAGVNTPEEQAAAIERARTNAEAAAKAVGQNAEQAQAAGEAAAATAQRSFNERQNAVQSN